MISPDVFSVDQSGKQYFVLREPVSIDEAGGLPSLHKIQSDTVKVQAGQCLIDVAHIAEISLEKDFDASFLREDPLIKALDEIPVVPVQIPDKCRLVKLDPSGAALFQSAEDLSVDRRDSHQIVFPRLLPGISAEGKQRIGACHNRLCFRTVRPGLRIFIKNLGAGKADLHIVLQFGDDIMVIGVEPLFHGQRLHIAVFPLIAPRHCEIGVHL